MSQPPTSPPGNIMASTSPPELAFVPRKEFQREQKNTANSFALLTVSGTNLIRLYSFPIVVIKALRATFENRKLVSFVREDTMQNCYEFTLEGKPWTMPKNVYTERLLLDIMTLLSYHGWSFLSSIDYGREHDDRVALTFSKPCAVHHLRGSSPAPPTPNASASNLHDQTGRRIFFGLSFASATTLRVISPPLNITPAILQAVRGAWPRGVVSEKKIGASAFEFKLKGYKWFQEDTFATDSLRHILTLLSSLDVYDFSLITSLSLGNRSRVKDLWLFAGPPQPDEIPRRDSPPASILHDVAPDLKRLVRLQDLSHSPMFQPAFQHRRFASSPANSSKSPPMGHTSHVRAATDGSIVDTPDTQFTDHLPPTDGEPSSPPSRRSRSISRKPAPRAQVPVSALYDGDPQSKTREYIRANLPSTVSDGTPNMTGVGSRGGSPDLFHPAPGWIGGSDTSPPGTPVAISTDSPPMSREHGPIRPPRSKTPPLVSNTSSYHPSSSPPVITHIIQPTDSTRKSTPSIRSGALLSPGVFRDSAFSTTDPVYDVPIKWAGPGVEPQGHLRLAAPQAERASSNPMFPGGWQPTPVEEKAEEDVNIAHGLPPRRFVSPHPPSPEGQLQEVRSRVESPEYKAGDHRSRKSEAGVVGLVADAEPPHAPPMPRLPDKGKGKEVVAHASSSSGQGWVLVNVDREPQSPHSPRPAVLEHSPGNVDRTSESRSRSSLQYTSAPESPRSKAVSDIPRGSLSADRTPVPPVAKAIVAMDAVEANRRARPGEDSSTSAVRRLFSLTRKNSHKQTADNLANREETDVEVTTQDVEATTRTKTKTKGVLRSKFKLMGSTPEASRNTSSHRRSTDGF